jgi:hypothetical protein
MNQIDYNLSMFEMDLINNLQFVLVVDTNRLLWEELDELEDTLFISIADSIDRVFDEHFRGYRNTEVEDITTVFATILKNAAWAAMNVPYPRNPDAHIDRVCDNLTRIYFEEVYTDIKAAMTRVDHHTRVIQRTWKTVICDPSYSVCKSRLFRELSDETRVLFEAGYIKLPVA